MTELMVVDRRNNCEEFSGAAQLTQNEDTYKEGVFTHAFGLV